MRLDSSEAGLEGDQLSLTCKSCREHFYFMFCIGNVDLSLSPYTVRNRFLVIKPIPSLWQAPLHIILVTNRASSSKYIGDQLPLLPVEGASRNSLFCGLATNF